MAINKVLVIGSGPIVIGQAAEFDYAGTQACKALREEGITSVLINSNPATIMTDGEVADVVYIEPLSVEVVRRVIARERPDGILVTLGGQTGLNLALALAEAGVLAEYKVRLLGTTIETIRKAEDRELFKKLLIEIGEPVPPSVTALHLADAQEFAAQIGYPLVIRPAFTLGGTGGGIATNATELEHYTHNGLAASPIHQVLVEQYLEGWKELEYEVIRDGADNCITICNMENIDPMGVHTGDSIVVAPSQTLSDKEYQMLRSSALKIIRALGIEGGCNVQFALDPKSYQYYVIEVNPRVSRSSALASKATGYPIARVATKIAVGKHLHEIPNAVTGKTSAAFEPALDYVVVKIPRWPFDKFPLAQRELGTQMKATGEVMAIDRCFEAALQKAVRSLELGGHSLLWEGVADAPCTPHDLRLWTIFSRLRRGETIASLNEKTGIDPWFLYKFQRIIDMEETLQHTPLNREALWRAKRFGFSDIQIASLTASTPDEISQLRHRWNLRPVYKMVDTCAAEFAAETPYFYSTYEDENEALPLAGSRAVVLGSGPIRIGQGIEFDYCSVRSAQALHLDGVSSIMINSNPETVSTDFDSSDRLYFEALDAESVQAILDNETRSGFEPVNLNLEGIPQDVGAGLTLPAHVPTPISSRPVSRAVPIPPLLAVENGSEVVSHTATGGTIPPAIVQFGGQTAINLAAPLAAAGIHLLGTPVGSIDLAEDRQQFDTLLQQLQIPRPKGATITSLDAAIQVAEHIGYPVLIRPSYVLGGRAMEIAYSESDLHLHVQAAMEVNAGQPVLIDRYLNGVEIEVDAISDGEEVLIPGIMEHIERAGVHSGDSFAVYPTLTLGDADIETLVAYTTRIALALGIKGLINAQFVLVPGYALGERLSSDVTGHNHERQLHPASQPGVYVLEVNPRASRTVPFLSKVTGVPMVDVATHVMLGKTLKNQGYSGGLWPRQQLFAVKAPVFSMSKLSGADTYLGPEMKSTGEVMGVDHTFPAALTKAFMAAGINLSPYGNHALVSIADRDKPEALPLLRRLVTLGYGLYATEGTAHLLTEAGIAVKQISKKLSEPPPTIVDLIRERQVDVVINTITGGRGPLQDGFAIRRAAVEAHVPCLTSLDTARAAIEALESKAAYQVLPLVEYRNDLIERGL